MSVLKLFGKMTLRNPRITGVWIKIYDGTGVDFTGNGQDGKKCHSYCSWVTHATQS